MNLIKLNVDDNHVLHINGVAAGHLTSIDDTMADGTVVLSNRNTHTLLKYTPINIHEELLSYILRKDPNFMVGKVDFYFTVGKVTGVLNIGKMLGYILSINQIDPSYHGYCVSTPDSLDTLVSESDSRNGLARMLINLVGLRIANPSVLLLTNPAQVTIQ